MSAEPLSPAPLMQLGMGFWASKTLLSAVELGVFTALAGQPADLETLRGRLGLHERGARDFLDALVALHLLERQDGIYANTPETELFLDRAKPSYLGGILEMANARLYGFWGRLTEALRSGLPQNEVRDSGEEPFAALYADPARLEAFLRAMTAISLPSARAMAAIFPWAKHRVFVDIGCAQGGLVAEIARSHPHLRGIGFDLPDVAPVFEAHIRVQGLTERVRFQPGNFFADALPEADAIVMGHILHDWNLEQKRLLVAKAQAALPKGGALVVYDAIIDDERRANAFGLLMSLNMLIETPGGFDYTGADCMGWMREAGFVETRLHPLDGPNAMVVGIK